MSPDVRVGTDITDLPPQVQAELAASGVSLSGSETIGRAAFTITDRSGDGLGGLDLLGRLLPGRA
jgi:hypothetical protein